MDFADLACQLRTHLNELPSQQLGTKPSLRRLRLRLLGTMPFPQLGTKPLLLRLLRHLLGTRPFGGARKWP